MRPRFRVFRDQDAWARWRWFGGWEWAPTIGDQTDFQQYWTHCGARRAAKRATHNDPKEQR